MATVRIDGTTAEVAVPISNLQPLKQVFLKLQRTVILKDEAGWRQVPAVPVPMVETGEEAGTSGASLAVSLG